MSTTMAILTVGVVPVAEVLPLLTEHIREEQITHISLLGKMTREDVMEDYALDSGDERGQEPSFRRRTYARCG